MCAPPTSDQPAAARALYAAAAAPASPARPPLGCSRPTTHSAGNQPTPRAPFQPMLAWPPDPARPALRVQDCLWGMATGGCGGVGGESGCAITRLKARAATKRSVPARRCTAACRASRAASRRLRCGVEATVCCDHCVRLSCTLLLF